MTLRRAEIAIFEQARTMVAAMPILRAAITLPVWARVGQVPSTRTRTGFSAIRPFKKIESLLFFTLSSSF